MAAILKLVQGSREWLDHRLATRNASETPIVLGCSPFSTPYQLWLLRTGRKPAQVNAAMRRGQDLEPAARAAYEVLTGQVMQPLVLQDGDYSASLDGITLAGDVVLEVKCPFKGKASELWQAVAIGELPEHYFWQAQHQLMVTKAKRVDVFIFDGSEGVTREVMPKPDSWPMIHAAWDKFAAFLQSDSPPPLGERDARVREDEDWKAAAAQYIDAKAAADRADQAVEAAKVRLVSLTQHPREIGSGVTVTRYWKTGSVDYKKIPELRGVRVDDYRGGLKEEVRITVLK
jgi:putative phage-type endonuclease